PAVEVQVAADARRQVRVVVDQLAVAEDGDAAGQGAVADGGQELVADRRLHLPCGGPRPAVEVRPNGGQRPVALVEQDEGRRQARQADRGDPVPAAGGGARGLGDGGPEPARRHFGRLGRRVIELV